MKTHTRVLPPLFSCFVVLAIVILVASCKSPFKYGKSQSFKLSSYERDMPLDKIVVDEYERHINNEDLNIPLNKYVVAKEYSIYFGVSFNHNSNEIYDYFNGSNDHNIVGYNKGTDVGRHFSLSVNNSFFDCFAFDSEKDKLTYLLTIKSDSIKVMRFHRENYLINRSKPK